MGDLSVLEAALAPDATWRGIDDGPWNCESCAGIMRVLRQNPTHRLDGRIEETIPYGERIMVAVPTLRGLAQRSPARRRIAYAVVTVHDGAITEIKSCATLRERGGLRNDGASLGAGRQPCAAARHRDQPTAARQPPDSVRPRDRRRAFGWIVADVRAWRPERRYQVWHDRAVFHFLTGSTDRRRYLDTLNAATARGAVVVIGAFAPDGPGHCSGLPVACYGPSELAAQLGGGWALIVNAHEEHITPSASPSRSPGGIPEQARG